MKSLLYSLTVLIFFSSCTKEETVTPTQNFSFGKNNLIGYTGAWDYQHPDSNVNKDIVVNLVGYSNQPTISVLTDSNGRFEFDSLEVGTYDIVISRPGWSTYRTKSFFHGPGPKPTIAPLENYYPFTMPINKLVRKVHSNIVSVTMDSIRNGYVYFCMNVELNPLDDLTKLEPYLIDRDLGDGNEPALIFNTYVKSIETNKIVFYLYTEPTRWIGLRKFDFILSSYEDRATAQNLVLYPRSNFEVTNAHQIIVDVTVQFP